MRSAILGFVGGAAVLHTCAQLPGADAMLACALLALVLLAPRCLPVRALRTACAGGLLGFCWAALLAHAALAARLDVADEGRDIDVVGTVATLPHDFGQGLRFQFAVETAAGNRHPLPPLLALSWSRGERDAARLRPGERWRLRVRLQRPHGNANPHGDDYDVWLLGPGVRAIG